MNLRKAWRVAKSTHPHSVIFLGDMMDNGFADMHIAECALLAPPLFVSLSHSAPHLGTRSMSNVSARSSPHPHPCRSTTYRETTMLASGTGLTRQGLHDHATELHSAHFPNTWCLVGIPYSWSMHLRSWTRIGAVSRRARAATTVCLKTSISSSTCACSTQLVRVLPICAHQQFYLLCPDAPLILLSHIPLYRLPNSSCGPLRERGSVPAVRGDGYQTQLSPQTSRLLLEEFRPSLIFRYLIPLTTSSVGRRKSEQR
jgi:hypothetical protein